MGSPDVGIFVNGGTQMNELNRFWTACMFLSLASNVTATSLIGYKFWYVVSNLFLDVLTPSTGLIVGRLKTCHPRVP